MSVVTDPIADFLTRVRNAVMAGQEETFAPYSRLKAEIARILKREGYIRDYSVDTSGSRPRLRVVNRYVDGAPALRGLRRVSRPGLRRYVGVARIPRVLGGLGICILSTPRGVMSGREAQRAKLGGELLAMVW
jgi:small subunit ribosomal protein S8